MKSNARRELNHESLNSIAMKIAKWATCAVYVAATLGPRAAIAGPTADEILEAARIAIQTQIPGSEFLHILEHADAIAVAVVNIRVRNEELRVLQDEIDGKIDGPTADARINRLEEIKSRLQNAKNRALGPHKDQGHEPSFARFASNVPLLSPLPGTAVLTLIPGSSSAFFVNPSIWGGGFSRVDALSGQIVVNIGAGGFGLVSQSSTMGSFSVNGQPTGISQSSILPGSPGSFSFDTATGSFTAAYNETITNSHYTPANPITCFTEVSGLVMKGGMEVAMWTTAEPCIIPGAPGQLPVDNTGMGYAPLKAVFDAAQRTLRFVDNVDALKDPTIAIERDPSGVYRSANGPLSALVGAALSVDPLHYLGNDPNGGYLFSDANFRIDGATTTVMSGRLVNPHIDPSTFQFLTDLLLDYSDSTIDDEFFKNFILSPRMQLLGPVATAELVAASDGFSSSAVSVTDFDNLLVPEPSGLALTGIGLLALLMAYRRRPSRNLIRR